MSHSPNKPRHYLAGMAALFVLLALIGRGAVQAQGSSRTFTETGKTVSGRFLKYWNEHGGLAQQGYPISGEFQERSDTDGKTYTVQYFERAVFEYHSELDPPNDVLLSLLGNMLYKQKYPGAGGAPHQNNNRPPGALGFPGTNKWIAGGFRVYWENHGGLAQQGYPISNEFLEVSANNGKEYMVQYFERAVFEYHPEFRGTDNEVLLSLLGTFRFKQKYPNGEPTSAPGSPVKPATATRTAAVPVKSATATRTSVMPTATPTDVASLTPTNPLRPGGRIPSGQSIFSSNGSYELTMQPNGNLALTEAGSGYTIWATGTGGNAGAYAIMVESGNFVIVSATGSPIWSSRTNIPGSQLVLRDTGALEIVAPNGLLTFQKPDHKSGQEEVRGPSGSGEPSLSSSIILGTALKMQVEVLFRSGTGTTIISLWDENNHNFGVQYLVDAEHPYRIFEMSSNTRVNWELDIPVPAPDRRITVTYKVLPGTRW